MLRVRLKSNMHPEWGEDVARLVRIAKVRGYDLNDAEAECAWEIRSREWSAGWLTLDGNSDDRIWDDLTRYALELEAPDA
jgi:hypothetical protein